MSTFFGMWKSGKCNKYTKRTGMELEIFASTEEDIVMLKDLFEKAEPVKASSSVIKNIIQEEAWGYFSGQKEVGDVAGAIQSRVSIYLNE